MNESDVPANAMGNGEGIKTFEPLLSRLTKAKNTLKRRTLEKRKNNGDAN